MAGKKNPRKRPATWADVEKAWKDGVLDGVANANALFLTVLADKFGGADYIPDIWEAINKLTEEINEGRLTFADLRRVLLEEYDIKC